MLDAPPGGCATLVVGTPVIILPQFWFALSANWFAETDFGCAAHADGSPPKQMLDLFICEKSLPRTIAANR